jgi:hypothetical protein
VATTMRTSNNVYVLHEIGKEECCLGKEDESWLWDKIVGHLNLENMVKVRRKEVLRETSMISKPTDNLCKQCIQGKQTRAKFPKKEYNMIKPL